MSSFLFVKNSLLVVKDFLQKVKDSLLVVNQSYVFMKMPTRNLTDDRYLYFKMTPKSREFIQYSGDAHPSLVPFRIRKIRRQAMKCNSTYAYSRFLEFLAEPTEGFRSLGSQQTCFSVAVMCNVKHSHSSNPKADFYWMNLQIGQANCDTHLRKLVQVITFEALMNPI